MGPGSPSQQLSCPASVSVANGYPAQTCRCNLVIEELGVGIPSSMYSKYSSLSLNYTTTYPQPLFVKQANLTWILNCRPLDN